ncbi:MAG TPA: DMT family transporter [Pseudonocardiaceae bacterium]|nr:DMT family transporter [Pseudonocardiaceae bacterium]
MSVPWVSSALALASAVCIGLSAFFGGLASRKTGPVPAVVWMELAGVPLTAVVAGVTTGERSLAMAADGLAIGVIAGAGLVCYYRALSVGAMVIAAPVAGAISSAIPAVIGIITGDRLRVLQLAGLVVAVIAIVLVAFQKNSSASARGIGMAMMAGVLLGVNYVFVKAGSAGGAWTAVWARCAVAVFVGLVAVVSGTRVVPVRPAWALVAAAGVFDTLGFLLLLFAYRDGVLSITTVLASLYPAVAVVLGWAILHERLRRVQAAGVVLALAAAGLMGAG